MRRYSGLTLRIVAIVIVLLAAGRASPPGSAQEATPGTAGVVLPADAEVAGLDLAAWNARSWQWFFSLPAAVNPLLDTTGANCGYGQSGPVFFLTNAEGSVERACVVPLGVHIFVPLVGSECSTIEPPPFFGRDEAELRRCATAAVDTAESALDMSAMRLTVDGQTVADFSTYRALTPRFTLWLPEDNLLGSVSQVADSVADGYQIMLSPLPAGEHRLEIVLPGAPSQPPITIAYTLTVVSGAYAAPPATPLATPTS